MKPLSIHVPQTFQYSESGEFGFLLLESLVPFADRVGELSAAELVAVYGKLEALTRTMFARNIVHTDIHEQNVMFRGAEPVLIDFEEARVLAQDCAFEESLDYVGATRLGTVGDMPSETGALPGHTCLSRLRDVVKPLVRAKLDALIQQCNFDSACPFLAALDHGKDERIYQSIDLANLRVEGQRPLQDNRIPQVLDAVRRHFTRPISHLDIGSNLGRFNLELSRSDLVARSIGVEAYHTYVDLSRVIAFLADNPKVRFHCAECGKDRLSDVLAGESIDCVTIYSVYHHIRDKAAFLADLKQLDPELVLFEMPVQPECYSGKTWQQEMDFICAALGAPGWELVARSDDYERPILAVKRSAHVAVAAARPRVSVVLPTYNHLEFLTAAIASVQRQTFGYGARNSLP